jgi:tRNA pseudouridine55 synthase
MFGFLNVDKPPGATSRDVVNRIQRLLRPLKVGHCGTLDPLATGVLVIAIGQATRLVEYVQQSAKTYQGTFLLGRSSDTEDIEGTVIEQPAAPIPSLPQIKAALPQFLGTILQRPPAYSALKVAGQRAHELARQGKSVELAHRPIQVHSLEIVRYAYPELELLVRCGSGTYIRSLGRDLAISLGTSAVMSQLRRLAIGPFAVSSALKMDELDPATIQQHLCPPLSGLGELPQITVSADQISRLWNGQTIPIEQVPQQPLSSVAEIAAVSLTGELVAILERRDSLFTPTKCFPPLAPRP